MTQVINWHPYPEEKPKDDGRYLVTLKSLDGRLNVIEDYYNELYDKWTTSNCYDWNVIAWADKPEPYKPTELLDMHQDAITARKYMEGDPETVKALQIFEE